MDASMFLALFPKASETHLEQMAAQAGALFASFGLTEAGKDNRLVFFLASLGHESHGCTNMHQDLSHFSPERLVRLWPSRFPTAEAAQPYVNNPEALANKAFAGRMGNIKDGDGYRYRGRGYFQLAGREAYAAVGTATGLDLVGNPDLAVAPEHALRVACGFWSWLKMNPVCDKGDLKAVARRLTGDLADLEERKDWLMKVRAVLGRSLDDSERA